MSIVNYTLFTPAMALKRLLTRIFNKSKASGSRIAQDIATAATPAPVPEVPSPSDQLPFRAQPAVPLAERSPATEVTLPLNVSLRLNIVLSPTGNGWLPYVSLRQGQAFATLGTICEGPATGGPATLLETSLSNSSVEFQITTTAMQPIKTVDATRDSIPSSVQGLGLSGLDMTGSQGTQITDRPVPMQDLLLRF